MAAERLQKILARGGVASRRKAEALISAGRVRVNGRIVRELGVRADPRHDRIEVDGKRLMAEHLVHLVVHKPRGMVATLHDPEGRPCVGDLLRGSGARVYPVGRLDYHTSGVLLATNDGELANALLHPSRGALRTYVVKLGGLVDEHALQQWRVGVSIGDRRPAKAVHVQHLRDEGGHSWVQLVLAEGRNHQVHRMAEAIGQRVMRLARTEFAGLTAEGLRPGELRPCTAKELTQLQALVAKPARSPEPSGAAHGRLAAPSSPTKRRIAPKRKQAAARQGPAKRGTALARSGASTRKTTTKRRSARRGAI